MSGLWKLTGFELLIVAEKSPQLQVYPAKFFTLCFFIHYSKTFTRSVSYLVLITYIFVK